MLGDFTLIRPDEYKAFDHLTIYPVGDVHIGSAEFDEKLFREWTKVVASDPCGAVAIIGDMMDMGLKNSKTNVYEQKIPPAQQKELCYDLLKPIANKILAGCSGNHEYRSVREAGTNPLYDVFCRLGIEDRYRENVCFIKLQVGMAGKNPNVYGVVLTHGKSKSKDEKWNYAVDGCDCFISGHPHETDHKPHGKIVMDLSHNAVKNVAFQHVVVQPFLKYGGYAVSGKYMPGCLGQFQRIHFDGTRKLVGYEYK